MFGFLSDFFSSLGSKLAAAFSWAKGEASLFSVGVVTQLKLEIPDLEASAISWLQAEGAKIVADVEAKFTSGDLKWSNAVSMFEDLLKSEASVIKGALLSDTVKETLLQDLVVALKAGLLAAQIVG